WESRASMLFLYEDSGAVPLVRVTVLDPSAGACEFEAVVEGTRSGSGFGVRGGTLAGMCGDATTPTELDHSERATKGELRCITNATERFRAVTSAEPVHAERFDATSSDGAAVECWAFRPDGDGPFPTLLNIHGGPFTQYGYRFFDEFQMQVRAG